MRTTRLFATRAVVTVGLVASMGVAGIGVANASTLPTAPTAVVASRGVAAPDQVIGKCDKVGSEKRAKTRFLLHAGLGFGAFHRYIYKPLKNGGFAADAAHRTKAFVKAALAGAFVLRELFEMDKFANADKTLCKIVPNISGATAGLTDLVGKLKGGSASSTDLTNVNGQFDSLNSAAGGLGANIKDKSTKIPGV